MDEIPKRVGPSRPWEGSEVLEVPSLTGQMNVTMDVEGVAREGLLSDIDWFIDHLGLLTRQRYTLPSSEGLGLLAPACASGVLNRSRRHTLSS